MRPLRSVVLLFVALTTILFVAPVQAQHLGGKVESAASSNKDAVRALVDPLIDRYAEIGKLAGSTMRSGEPDAYAADLFLLEHNLVNLLTYVPNAKGLTDAQKQQVTSEVRSLLGQVQWNYRSLLEEMRNRTEKSSPGTSGTTLVEPTTNGDGTANDVYYPSFKGTTKLTKAEQARRYEALRQKHEEKYPGEKPHFRLNKSTLDGIQSGELLEWVETPGGQIRVTRNAKHAVVAGGRQVRSAGALKIFWGKGASGKQEPVLVLVSNWSGTYQPDMGSVAGSMMSRLRTLGVPQDRIVITPAMPLEPKVYEVLLASRKVANAPELGEKLRLDAQKTARGDRARWAKSFGSSATTRPLPGSRNAALPRAQRVRAGR